MAVGAGARAADDSGSDMGIHVYGNGGGRGYRGGDFGSGWKHGDKIGGIGVTADCDEMPVQVRQAFGGLG